MEAFVVLIVSMIAGVLAYTISVTMEKGGVFGSAVVTLTAGVLFRYLETEGLILYSGLAVVATCASYAGMVAQKNVADYKEMALVGLLAGIIYLAGASVYTGVGGRLGVIAAIACFTWIGVKKLLRKRTSTPNV